MITFIGAIALTMIIAIGLAYILCYTISFIDNKLVAWDRQRNPGLREYNMIEMLKKLGLW